MTYTDFTLETVESNLGIIARRGRIFSDLAPLPVPDWLEASLRRGMRMSLVSEKARSEFIVAPILLMVCDLSDDRVSIMSGQRLDVDSARGLAGECDFLLSLAEPLPRLRAPFLAIVEAKKNDIDAGLGQCVAQMIAARAFNEKSGQSTALIFGCVTSGAEWQFLQLAGETVTIDPKRVFIDNVGLILATFHEALRHAWEPA